MIAKEGEVLPKKHKPSLAFYRVGLVFFGIQFKRENVEILGRKKIRVTNFYNPFLL